MNFARHALWLFGLLAIFAGPLLAAEYTGKVVGVSDGDTLTLLVPDGNSFKQVKVRLGEIDTPERKQPYGTRAQQALSDLAYNKQARVVVQDTDRYGRTVGRVYVGQRGRERGDGQAGRGVGVPPVPQGSIAADARTAGQGRQTWPVGTAGSANAARPGTGGGGRAPPHRPRRPMRQRLRLPPRPQPPAAAASPAPASGVAGR